MRTLLIEPPSQGAKAVAESVDGFALYTELKAVLRRYLVATPQQIAAIALWIIFAHAHDAFWISPRLASFRPRSGAESPRFSAC